MDNVKLSDIKVVAAQYVHLLERAGINTVDELTQINAYKLQQRLSKINEQQHLVRQSPSTLQIRAWVARAKELPSLKD